MDYFRETQSPILGYDGIIYEFKDDNWQSIFVYPGWNDYITSLYEEYVADKILMEELVQRVSDLSTYKRISGYDGEINNFIARLEHNNCGLNQKIYKIIFTLLTLSKLGLDDALGVNYDVPLIDNAKDILVDKIKISEAEHIIPQEYAKIGIHNRTIIIDPSSYNMPIDLKNCWVYLSKDDWVHINNENLISDELIATLQDKTIEYVDLIMDKLSVFNLEEDKLVDIKNLITKNIELKLQVSEKELPNISNLADIIALIDWEANDLINGAGSNVIVLWIPPEKLKDADKIKYYEYVHKQYINQMKILLSIDNFEKALNHYQNTRHCGDYCYAHLIYEIACGSQITVPASKQLTIEYLLAMKVLILLKGGLINYYNDLI